jgi:hypothetical protein
VACRVTLGWFVDSEAEPEDDAGLEVGLILKLTKIQTQGIESNIDPDVAADYNQSEDQPDAEA